MEKLSCLTRSKNTSQNWITSGTHHWPHHPRSQASGEYRAGLQVTKCVCRVDNLDLNIHGSGHDWMHYLLGPYIRRRVRQKIEESVVNYFMNMDLMTTLPVPSVTSPSSQPISSQVSARTS